MGKLLYNWKRFWCPRDGNINLSDGGYLYDPDSPYGNISNPDVVPFESIARVPCLILLGEPGIGKSYALHTEKEDILIKIQERHDELIWLDLRSYGDEDRLIRELFDNETINNWKGGTNLLHIYLDSLDECLLRIDQVAALLLDKLTGLPIERLNFRIACRTADWPNGLELGLKQLWGRESVGIYELAPLRRLDVIEAAKINGLISESFINEIDQKEVVSLAIKPVTLNFLINTYQKSGQFPSTQAELYFEGCHLLCEETSESRRDSRRLGQFTAIQRLTVAGRIAAITIFTRRYAIWTGLDKGDVPQEDIIIEELCGQHEFIGQDELPITEVAVKEALGTGLFSSRGPNRMGWTHQSYAEFLAARYILENHLTLPQILGLIVHPNDPEQKLIPQLHETAAWLATMEPGVFREIIKIDPEVLLRSDVASANIEDKKRLVKILLKLSSEEKITPRFVINRQQYRKLAHPELAEQLKPYIIDETKSILSRQLAIDIALTCEIKELQGELLEITLNTSQQLPIRVIAAGAISKIADEEIKSQLIPLIDAQGQDDPEDELKGCALIATMPKHITAKDLFSSLSSPKKRNLYGTYKVFLSQYLMEYLKPNDLPVALAWVKDKEPTAKTDFFFSKLTDSIMYQGWVHLDIPGVLEPFAKAALSKLQNYKSIVSDKDGDSFRDELITNDTKRRKLVDVMVQIVTKEGQKPIRLGALVLSKDVLWMIDRLQSADSNELRKIWAKLINLAYDYRDTSQTEAIVSVSKTTPELAEGVARYINPIELDSPEAKRLKEDYLESQKWEKPRTPPLLEPPPKERIVSLLDKFEFGDLNAWWLLNMEITLEPHSTYYGDEFESDLTNLPGWMEANEVTKKRIIEAAKRYILEGDPKTDEWIGKQILYRPAYAGYRALSLLLQESPEFTISMSPDVWKKWAPMILAYPISGGIEEREHADVMVNKAYQYASHEIIKTLTFLIDKENEKHDFIHIINRIEVCFDKLLGDSILVKANDIKLKPSCMGDLLRILLEKGVEGAQEFAEALIQVPLPGDGLERKRAIIAAQKLFAYAQDAGWDVVWPAIQYDPEFAREVIAGIANEVSFFKTLIGHNLEENQLADLYILLVHEYPYDEDPKYEEAHAVGPREQIAHFRDAVLNSLKTRGTEDSYKEIQRISSIFPEIEWLKWVSQEARIITLRDTWIPPRSCDILTIVNDSSKRLVQNGEQLLHVVMESLARLEAKLQGETPASIDLWNELPDKKYRPKDENRFSDYIKRHLDEDLTQKGIVVNREVEIRRGTGGGTGEITDIHVDAVIKNASGEVYDNIALIIENKACWNTKLYESMETQLVNRYLKDNNCRYGLYFVGWFFCPQWDESDERKQKCSKIDIHGARRVFDDQAIKLSVGGKLVMAMVINVAIR